MGLLEGAPQYEEAREAGKSVGEASLIGGASTVGTAVLEGLSIGMFLKMLRPAGKEIAKKGIKGLIESKALPQRVIKGFVGEGLQEDSQTLWQNAIKKYGYDDTQELAEGLVESFIGGAGMGGITGGVMKPGKTVTEKYDNTVKKLKAKGATDEELGAYTDSLVDQLNQKGEKELSDEEGKLLSSMMKDRPQGPVSPDEIIVDPQKAVILKTEKADRLMAEATGEAVDDGFDPKLVGVVDKTNEVTTKLAGAKVQKEQKAIEDQKAIVLEEANALAEEERLNAVPQNLEQFDVDVVEGKVDIGNFEDYGLTTEDLSKRAKEQEAKKEIDKQAAAEEQKAQEETDIFDESTERQEVGEMLKEGALKGKTIKATTEKLDDEGKADGVEGTDIDAEELVVETNKRSDAIKNIFNCLGK